MKKFQFKRWMVITAIFAALGGSIAFASCQSNVGGGSGTITCTMEDCNTEACNTEECNTGDSIDCSNVIDCGDATTEKGCQQNCGDITYNCNGTDMNCSQYMCYGETYNCMNSDGCNACTQNCTTNCTQNCVEQNCNGADFTGNPGGLTDCTGNKTYTYRLLEHNSDYTIQFMPKITSSGSHIQENGNYEVYLYFKWDATFYTKNIKGIVVLYNVYDEDDNYIEVSKYYETYNDLLNAMKNDSLTLQDVDASLTSTNYTVYLYKIYAYVQD